MSGCFRLHGQLFRADDVPGWVQLTDEPSGSDVIEIDVRGPSRGLPDVCDVQGWAVLPPALPPSAGFDLFRRTGPNGADLWMLRVTGASGARLWLYFCPAENRLIVWWSLDGDPEAISRFLFTIGLSWLFRLTGRRLCLHAAAVMHRGGGVVICGDAGQGKSTLAAAFRAAGARLIAADMASIGSGDADQRGPHLAPGVPFDDMRPLPSVPGDPMPADLPVRLVVALAPRAKDGGSRLIGLEPQAALTVLSGLLYPRGMIAVRSLMTADLAHLAGLLRSVPCHRLERPNDVGLLQQQVEMIEMALRAA